MRIIIIGCTQSTRRIVLDILKNKKYEVVAIFSLQDKDFAKKARFALMDDIAFENDIELHKIGDINDQMIINLIKKLNPDIVLEVGWSQIISKDILEIPSKGTIGIHCSFLPKNQGAASLNWALIKGEKEWGVTLFYLKEKIDTGDIIDQRKFPIDKRDNIETLFDKADFLSIQMLQKNLPLIKEGTNPKIKQNKEESTYLPKRKPEDGEIKWGELADSISALVRALAKPYPGAFTYIKDERLFILDVEILEEESKKHIPGTIIGIIDKRGIVVSTGDKNILVKRLRKESDAEMWADHFAKEYDMKEFDTFE
ncbi:hypothetical protein CMO93_01920 [Candidatus Woesearchaeota archaeon]|nr:hypothetical protein [Candidatus Woesearchaeota archaeon]|tara:strand:- start:1576 stop:2511 length:936 start_codon:yes stop_codon:yes gene_type:complete